MTHSICYVFDVPARLAHIDRKGRPAFNADVALWMDTTCKEKLVHHVIGHEASSAIPARDVGRDRLPRDL